MQGKYPSYFTIPIETKSWMGSKGDKVIGKGWREGEGIGVLG